MTDSKALVSGVAKVAVADLNLRSYEEFEAKAKDVTADGTVAEIEAARAPLWGSRSMSVTTRQSPQWWRGSSRSRAALMCSSRMQAEVVVGLWTQRRAP
jgi:hypothetical protein